MTFHNHTSQITVTCLVCIYIACMTYWAANLMYVAITEQVENPITYNYTVMQY